MIPQADCSLPQLITERKAAELLGLPVRVLKQYRTRAIDGVPQSYVILGRLVRYEEGEVLEAAHLGALRRRWLANTATADRG